jgi:Xylose isomerase-like TIM barrel
VKTVVTAVNSPDRADPNGLSRHHPLGISTGVLFQQALEWHELVDAARRVSRYAVELSALSGEELPGLVAFLREDMSLPFRYVSVHAPSKQFSERAVIAQLQLLPMNVQSIIVHPDVVTNIEAYVPFGSRLVFENMDDRKHAGRTAEELSKFFEAAPHAGFCLDIAHAHSIDPTMAVAHELLDRYRSRLRQVHLSSLDSCGHHIELSSEDERSFAEVLDRCTDVPWIMESEPPQRWAAQAMLNPRLLAHA